MEKAKRMALALALAGALGASMVGDVSAGKEDGQAQREARSQAGGTFLFGEPGVDRGAQPDPGGEPGCTAANAINSNPPQAAGDNAAFPNENAAPQGEGPFFRCFGP